MVTTHSPCGYCSGLVREVGITRLVVGEARTFSGGHDWLAEHGVEVHVLDDGACVQLMTDFIAAPPSGTRTSARTRPAAADPESRTGAAHRPPYRA